MTSLLFAIALSALLSVTSLLIILFRVSPLTAPDQAIPAFFLSVFLSVSTLATLLLLFLLKRIPNLNWDTGKIMSASLRQGIFLGLATVIVLGFFLANLLNWWIAALIFAVFVLIELALHW